MPKSVFFEEEKINCLGNELSVRKSAYLSLIGGLIFIMDDHNNFPNWIMILNSMFPSWMMTLNSMFPNWRIIQYFSYWVRDFLALS